MQDICHIVSEDLWKESTTRGVYRGDTLDTEGFIHCSTTSQVIRTANRFFQGCTGLVVLRINPAKLTSTLIYEDTSGCGEDFPHIYGPLNLSAVEGVQTLVLRDDGLFEPLSQEWDGVRFY